MPRAAVKVQGAPNITRWTLAKSTDYDNTTPVRASLGDHDDTYANDAVKGILGPGIGIAGARLVEKEKGFKMQTNGHQQPNGLYFHDDHQNLPRYSYDGSQYSEDLSARLSTQGGQQHWRPPQNASRNVSNYSNNYDGFDFNMSAPEDPRASKRISVNTGVHNVQRTANQDAVSQHLLYETALMDSQTFEIMEIAEVDALKKEHVRLNQKIEAMQRKLALESKVRDAAQNLQRLYSTKNRPDTPQDPDSPRKNRHSLLGNRLRSGSGASQNDVEHLQQADHELASSVKKVDELHAAMKDLLDRRQYVERKLLRHTAAVLAEEANKNAESAVPGLRNGHHGLDDDNDPSAYTPNEFDGIRDILRGMPAGSSTKVKEHEEQIASMQTRLEQLNLQLRKVINEASQTLGTAPVGERGLDDSEDSTARVENRFARLEDTVYALGQQQDHMRNTVEGQLQSSNAVLHNALLMVSETQAVPGLQQPPQPTGYGYQNQMQYLEDNLMTMEQLLQQQHQSGSAQKLGEYETTVSGLWELLRPDAARRPSTYEDEDDEEQDRAPPTPLNESFSLPAFSSLVQLLHDKVQSAKDQHDILRRQIQQQRDLNGKSDAEKDRAIADWEDKHHELKQDHSALQQELANWMVKQEATENEAGQNRTELMNVMTELEEMKTSMEAKQAEREAITQKLSDQISLLETRAQEHSSARDEMETLESEVVRLTTELTMAKAELDTAYGSRSERAGAQAQEVEALSSRNQALLDQVSQLERELSEMTAEFQDLTKESIELEKEREGLDSLIDGLRERCEMLETQLGEEKLRWVGIKSPTSTGGGAGQDGGVAREGTSMMVLRQEFKKMMREQRGEGMKVLKAEQEERRRLEGELRKLRQANGPLGKKVESASESATPV